MNIDYDARSARWALNPEPMRHERDPQTVLESEPVTYLWNTHNDGEWLYFDGETADVRR